MASKKRKTVLTNRMQGVRLSYNASDQAKYVRDIKKLVLGMIEKTEKSIIRLFEGGVASEFFAEDASITSKAKILLNKLSVRFESLFGEKSKKLAKSMVKRSEKASASSLTSSLNKFSDDINLRTKTKSVDLHEIIKASVSENVDLIKSIKSYYLFSVKKQVFRSITTGNGLQDLVPALQNFKGITLRKAKNMALDQTRKVYNNVNAERMKRSGIEEFIWVHSGSSQSPRKDHIEMDGNKYSFDNLPIIVEKTGERGIPGQAINCRCTMKPVYDFGGNEQ